MGMTAWSDEHIQILRKMVAAGKPSHEIAQAVGRTPSTVRSYLRNNKDKLELTPPDIRGRNRWNEKQFDKLWRGSVPYLHWAMTKKWGSNS